MWKMPHENVRELFPRLSESSSTPIHATEFRDYIVTENISQYLISLVRSVFLRRRAHVGRMKEVKH